MKTHPAISFATIAILALAAVAYASPALSFSATVKEQKTSEGIQAKYAEQPTTHRKVHVLLVPGHEPRFGGTEFWGLKERDLVLDLSGRIAQLMEADGRLAVSVSRNDDEWDERLERTFVLKREEITKFVRNHKNAHERLARRGEMETVAGVSHNAAPEKSAMRLYGINRWANDAGVDLALHIHFNDYVRADTSLPGEHTGYAIYVPESQLGNSTASTELAESIAANLQPLIATSTLPGEAAGIVPDQELIAIGAYDTAAYPSILIEYSYIYESYLHDPATRETMLDELALRTYAGLQDYLLGRD
jgi:N-acetylmuramoyl-L-alanine amidase